MEDFEFTKLHDWGLRVSRLIELIALTNRTIRIHQEHEGSLSQINDYKLLLAKHQKELNGLMHEYGLSVNIQPLESAA